MLLGISIEKIGMSRKYKFQDNEEIYFVTFAVVSWIDVFIRNEYKDILVDSLKFCQKNKDLDIYGWCIMTSHVHLIIGSRGNLLSNILRDLKRHTSVKIKAINNHPAESRREWMLSMMKETGMANNNNNNFQLWQQNNHPIELSTEKNYAPETGLFA
ncbi:MAG: Transposase like protein [Bacteroidota bacterium]|nr:Transposase like protein [Bacteroidota bacterium]